MRRIIISTAIAMSAAAAYADPVTVMTPKPGASADELAAYVDNLDKAVKSVCKDNIRLARSIGFVSYSACLKETRIGVSKQDPTGLYAATKLTAPMTLAAK